MPNHVHFLLRIEGRAKRIKFMHSFKVYSSAEVRQFLLMENPANAQRLSYRYRAQTYKVWEDGYASERVYDAETCLQYLQLMHANPGKEKWSLVGDPVLYPFSSAAYYASGEQGIPEVSDYRNYFRKHN